MAVYHQESYQVFLNLAYLCLKKIVLLHKYALKEWTLLGLYAELQKAGFMGSAEPDFFQILRQICPVFRQNFTKFYQILPKFTKVYKSLLILPNLTNILPNFT